MTNYIADRNRFSLEAPPKWWLVGVARFDPDIVFIPSRMREEYLMTRRQKYSANFLGTPIQKSLAKVDGDAAMCAHYRLVPFGTVISHGTWNLETMLAWLKARDTWGPDGPLTDDKLKQAMFEGGSKFTKQVDAADKARAAKQAREQKAIIYDATGEGWTSLQMRKGRRILSAGPASQPKPSGLIVGV